MRKKSLVIGYFEQVKFDFFHHQIQSIGSHFVQAFIQLIKTLKTLP
jgi:hypothetical protein